MERQHRSERLSKWAGCVSTRRSHFCPREGTKKKKRRKGKENRKRRKRRREIDGRVSFSRKRHPRRGLVVARLVGYLRDESIDASLNKYRTFAFVAGRDGSTPLGASCRRIIARNRMVEWRYILRREARRKFDGFTFFSLTKFRRLNVGATNGTFYRFFHDALNCARIYMYIYTYMCVSPKTEITSIVSTFSVG